MTANPVAVLLSGAAVGQLVSLAASPLISRLYSPADIGALATMLSMVAMMTVVASGRYEFGVVPARSDQRAVRLSEAAFLATIATSAVLSFYFILRFWLVGDGVEYWWFILIAVVTVTFERICSTLLSRGARFNKIARSRVVQSSAVAAGQISLGLLNLGTLGLVLGQIFGQTVAAAMVYRWSRRIICRVRRLTGLGGVLRTARSNWRFPMLVVPASLAGEVVGNAPIVFIAAIYGVEKAGLFAMASRLLTAPVSMVAGAVGEAYRVKASTAFHEKKDCREEIMSHSRFVTITALVVSLPIAIFGEELFSIIFGTSWAEAGVIARVLSILVFFQMLSLPFSQTVFVVGKPSLDAFWNLSRLFSLLIGMYAVVFFKLSFEVFLVFVVVHGCLFYSANMIMQWKVAKHTH